MSKKDLIISRPQTRTYKQLKRLQSLPLNQKIALSQRRISQFYNELGGMVYVSFSGGKDSTVLIHLVRSLFPKVVAVFCDTGLEYPEVRSFVKSIENVEWLTPKIPFNKIIEQYGYPVPSKEVAQKIEEIRNTKSDRLRNKRMYGDCNGNGKLPLRWQFLIDAPFKISGKCCSIMKKNPAKAYERNTGLSPIIGTMAQESRLREQTWMKNGCNAFNGVGRSISAPLSFWTDNDVWEYIHKYKVKYSRIYDMGEKRTGCMFCLFGCQFDDEDGRRRFDRMEKTHPKQYSLCEKIGVIDVLHYLDKKLGRDQMELFE